MKQLGNLAIVAAQRSDISLYIYKGFVSVCVGDGPARASMSAKWSDDEKIHEMVMELNHGKYKQQIGMKGAA